MVTPPRSSALLVTRVCAMVLACTMLLTCNHAYAEISDRQIRQHVRDLFTTVDGVDAILDGALAQKSTVSGVSWLEVFRFLMAADRVAEKIETKHYGLAVAEAAKHVSREILAQMTFGASLTSALAVGSLAALPVDLGLRRFARNATNDALNWQIKRYIQVRSAPFNRSHEFVMEGKGDDQIWFDDQGWISVTDGDTGSRGYLPGKLPYARDQVYALAKHVFEASKAAPQLPRERQRVEMEFRAVLGRAAGHQSAEPSGSFDGEWYSSDHRYAFRINDTVGVATLSNSINYSIGQEMLRMQNVVGPTFKGTQIFTSGQWVPVTGRLIDADTLQIRGGGFTWIMKRRSTAN